MADQPQVDNPFAGLLTSQALASMRDQQAMQQAIGPDGQPNPWLLMAARAGRQLQDFAISHGHLAPEDVRAQRTDRILKSGIKAFNAESSKPDADPTKIMSRLTTEAFHQFLDAGDVQSASVLAPHVFQSLAAEAELAKLQGTDAATVAEQKLKQAKQDLDVQQQAETERANKENERINWARVHGEKGPARRTQVISAVDPDTGKPVNQLVDLDTGELINPNISDKPQSVGARGAAAQQRFAALHGSASLATKAIENLSHIPLDTNRGIFGSAEPGKTLTGSTLSALGNTMTTGASRRYKVLTTGLRNNLAIIERQGASQGIVGLTARLDQIESIPGDDYITQASRLAEARQIVEEGVKTYQTSPTITEEQKEALRELQRRLEKAIPYTQDDITALQYDSKYKGKTLADVVKDRKGAEAQAAKTAESEALVNKYLKKP
jgi:hypothetical protein